MKLERPLFLKVAAVLLVAALVAAGGRKVVEAVWAGVQQGAMIALVALGYTMVYGILKLINFAHSEVFMMSAYFGIKLTEGFMPSEPGASPVFAGVAGTLCAMVFAGMLGVAVEKIAYAPLRSRSRGKTNSNTRITPLVTALGMSVLLQNLAQLVFSPMRRNYPQILQIGNVRLFVFVLAVAVMGALQFLVYRTWFGKSMRAVSVNMEAARLMGIRTSRVIGMTFVTGSMLAAIGAILFCMSQSQVYPTMGTIIGTRSFVAAVIGGIGSIPGAMLGGVLIGVVGELTKLTDYSGLQDVIIFVVLIAVLLVRPTGLLGKAGIEKV